MAEVINKTLGETIKNVLVDRGLNLSTIAKKMNVTRTVISQLNKRKNFDIEFLAKLEEATGLEFSQYVQVPDYMVKALETGRSPLTPNQKKDELGIPYFNTDVTVLNTESELPTYYMVLPGFEDCDFAINVSGQAMAPDYGPGDVILCKKLKNHNVIPLGEAYLLITDEHKLLRKIKKGDDKSNVTLNAVNKEFDDWIIERKEIQMLYLIKGKLERTQI